MIAAVGGVRRRVHRNGRDENVSRTGPKHALPNHIRRIKTRRWKSVRPREGLVCAQRRQVRRGRPADDAFVRIRDDHARSRQVRVRLARCNGQAVDRGIRSESARRDHADARQPGAVAHEDVARVRQRGNAHPAGRAGEDAIGVQEGDVRHAARDGSVRGVREHRVGGRRPKREARQEEEEEGFHGVFQGVTSTVCTLTPHFQVSEAAPVARNCNAPFVVSAWQTKRPAVFVPMGFSWRAEITTVAAPEARTTWPLNSQVSDAAGELHLPVNSAVKPHAVLFVSANLPPAEVSNSVCVAPLVEAVRE